MTARARPLALALIVTACGARTELAGSAGDGGAFMDVPSVPLEISASFYVSYSNDPARPGASANGVFWTGARRPMPGGGGPSHRLVAGESISVNGVALAGGFADWGYTYQSSTIPPPSDGRWVFRFVIRGQTITRTLTLRSVQWVDFPTGPVSIRDSVTLRWAPPLPEETTRRAYLTSCVLNERTEITPSSATFFGRLSASPCVSHAQLYATLEAPLGAPFREGSTIAASTGLDQTLRVVP